MKNKLRKRLAALALCGVMVFSGSSSALADSPAGEIEEAGVVQEVVEDIVEDVTAEPVVDEVVETPEVLEEVADTEVDVVEEEPEAQAEEIEEATDEVVSEEIVEEVVDEVTEEVVEETPEEVQPTIAEKVTEVAEKVAEVVEKVIKYIIGMHDDLTYEDDQVIIKVYAEKDEIIPEGTKIKVVPILADDEETKEKYEEVATGLQEKAAEDEQIIEGFLAYDITLVDSEGNEFEPNGEVKVSMEYKEAILPAEIENVEEAEVTIHHFEEDENGEVKEIVDMIAEEAIEAAVEVTEAVEVEKAEFKTESFSVFTITWRYSNSNRSVSGTVVTTEGELLDVDDKTISLGNSNSNTIQIDNVDFDSITIGSETYAFSKAVVCRGGYSENNVNVTSINYSSTNRNYRANNNSNYVITNDNSGYSLYFVYDKVESLTTVNTVDHTAAGIVMTMTNYNNTGFNQTSFMGLGGGWANGRITQGLLKNKLGEDGYPETAGGRSLKDAFAASNTTPVNHLFTDTTFDTTGYYEFNSFENYAYLNADGDFTVYEQIGSPENSTSSNTDKILYQRGHFYPYNNITAGNILSNQVNLYDEDGQPLNEDHPRYREELYKIDNPDYYFGMYVEATFVQPEGGLVNGNHMVYEFNGDDDLWVFIDDVLVLDLGGIHLAHRGYIDFTTGDVAWDTTNTGAAPVVHTNLKEIYSKLGIFPDGTTWDEAKVDKYFKENTFADYTGHEMKMFYMERGAGGSDIHVKFNLPVVPKGTIEIKKELTNTDKQAYANVEFAYQVFAQKVAGKDANGVETYSDEYEALPGAVYKGTENLVKTNESGDVFYLKDSESAFFSGLQANRKYYVVEVGVNAQEYDKVEINGAGYKEYDENDQEHAVTDNIETDKVEVSHRPLVIFENNCSIYNNRDLLITKQMANGQTTSEKFKFFIELEGKDGVLVPYQGEYYLNDVVGTTTDGYVNNISAGDTVKISGILSGTEFRVTEVELNTDLFENPTYDVDYCDEATISGAMGSIKLSKTETAQVIITNSLKTTSMVVTKKFVGPTGEVISAPADLAKIEVTIREFSGNKTIATHVLELTPTEEGLFKGELTNLKTYTEFEVVEDSERMLTAESELIANSVDWSKADWTYSKSETNAIIQAELTNQLSGTTEITVNKVWVDDNNKLNSRPSNISVSVMNGETVVDTASITAEDEWAHTFTGLDKYAADGTLVTYTVTEGEVPGYESNVEGTTITNKLQTTWSLVKVSSSDSDLTLTGAEFELRNSAGEVITGISDENGEVIWNNVIPYGEYALVETKAPLGFILSTETWTVILEEGKAPVIKNGETDIVAEAAGTSFTFYFENEALYALPSTGGLGIYVPMTGGVIMMMAAAFILMNNKRKEVLER